VERRSGGRGPLARRARAPAGDDRPSLEAPPRAGRADAAYVRGDDRPRRRRGLRRRRVAATRDVPLPGVHARRDGGDGPPASPRRSTTTLPPGRYLSLVDTPASRAYDYDPCVGVAAPVCARVLGLEAAVWGEKALRPASAGGRRDARDWGRAQVDAANFEATAWPRAAAVAERAWSPGAGAFDDAAERRLADFRCHLVSRGVGAGRARGRARDAPGGPGACRS